MYPRTSSTLVPDPPPHLHDASQLLDLILPREQWISRVQLRHDAAQAPHINGHVVGVAQNHLGGSVEPALDVRIHCDAKGEKHRHKAFSRCLCGN